MRAPLSRHQFGLAEFCLVYGIAEQHLIALAAGTDARFSPAPRTAIAAAEANVRNTFWLGQLQGTPFAYYPLDNTVNPTARKG